MTYAAAISIVLISGVVAALITGLLHRLIEFDLRRHHHDAGSVVFLQLGVVFAVLLAFVFNEVWSDYNVAAQAINSECAGLHGVAILSDRLPPVARDAILKDLRAYLTTVINQEWPDMRQRNESRVTASDF